jgi:hypothetical protein
MYNPKFKDKINNEIGQLLHNQIDKLFISNPCVEIELNMEPLTSLIGRGDIFSHSRFVEAVIQNTSPQNLIQWAQSYSPKDEWESLLIKSILSACPTSLGIIYALWEKAKNWNVAESFYNDWFVATQCGKNGNFQEGVRALLIDKDNKPQWKPATVKELSTAHIEAHFVSPREDGKNPLEYLLRA